MACCGHACPFPLSHFFPAIARIFFSPEEKQLLYLSCEGRDESSLHLFSDLSHFDESVGKGLALCGNPRFATHFAGNDSYPGGCYFHRDGQEVLISGHPLFQDRIGGGSFGNSPVYDW